ncbi:hypothetical protein WA026_013033 [Henosepilachna vigintioctopunctata]|uniref:Uncharacterized protein n=1 Tax=Henosepilachna vigintioctopunctata TaxID=420089 RepID=A0AAW1UAG7_9CUCU
MSPTAVRPYLKNALKEETSRNGREKGKSRPMSDSDSSESELLKVSDVNDDEEPDDGGEKFIISNPENINFLLIKFEEKKSVVHYVAKLISIYSLNEYEVLYLRKNPRSYIFVFPEVEDQAMVDF